MATMSYAAFDTLKAMRRLKAAGVEEGQAEAMVEAFAGALTEDLATRQGLAHIEEKLTAKIDSADEKLTAKIEIETATLGKEIFRAMFVMAFAIVGLTVTLIKLLP